MAHMICTAMVRKGRLPEKERTRILSAGNEIFLAVIVDCFINEYPNLSAERIKVGPTC